jgi:hypothetical protein
MDNSSEIFSTFSGGNTVAGAQNPFDNSRGERALSGLDFPHTASIYFIYEFPFYKSQKGIIGHLLGGYQSSGTWRFSTGQLWTPANVAGVNSSCQTSFDISFFSGISACRLFNGSKSAPVDTVGQCTNPTAVDCGLVDFYTGTALSMSAVRWIYNDDNAATFFKTPYGNSGRNPGYRGDAVNTINFGMSKSTKLSERVSLRFEAQVYNLFNHQVLGVPDPIVDDCNLANKDAVGCSGSFGNNLFNSSGGDYTNTTLAGLGRRRMILGAKIVF